MTIRTVAPSQGSREPTDLQTYGRFPQCPSVPSDLHTFTPRCRVKPKIGTEERERCCRSFMAHFFERQKNEPQKITTGTTSLRSGRSHQTGTSSLRSRRPTVRASSSAASSPKNESKGPVGSSWRLASGARSDRDLFCPWLRLRARDDEPRKAGGTAVVVQGGRTFRLSVVSALGDVRRTNWH